MSRLNQGTNRYYPLETATKVIELRPQGYTPFDTNAETLASLIKAQSSMDVTSRDTTKSTTNSYARPSWPNPPPPSFLDPDKIAKDDLRKLVVFLRGSLTLLSVRYFPLATLALLLWLILAAVLDDSL
jgi:hypothetical protein